MIGRFSCDVVDHVDHMIWCCLENPTKLYIEFGTTGQFIGQCLNVGTRLNVFDNVERIEKNSLMDYQIDKLRFEVIV